MAASLAASEGKRGFTLIELLVVVAIIALLASLLLPSLSKARERAREAVCTSHLKQVGYASVMYSDANGGWWPYQEAENVPDALKPGGNESWGRLLLTYLGGDTKAYYCPSTKGLMPRYYEWGWSEADEAYTVGYLYNGAAAAFKRTRFEYASKKIIVHDLGRRYTSSSLRVPYNPAYWQDWYCDYPWPQFSVLSNGKELLEAVGQGFQLDLTWNIHHHGKVIGRNLLMMDGHVQWHPWGTALSVLIHHMVTGKEV